MSGFSIDPTTQTCYIGTVEEVQPQNVQKNVAEKAIPMVEEQKTTDVKDNTVLTSALTVENFKESMEIEFGCSFNDIDDDRIKERFQQLLKKLSDDEKTEKLMLILTEFGTKPALIEIFFNSFEKPEKAMEYADSISYENFKNLKKEAQSELMKHVSAPGANKMFSQCEFKAYDYYHANKDIIDEVYSNNWSNEERLAYINNLPAEKRAVIEQYNKYTDILLNIIQGVLENENISQEDKDNLITDSWNLFQELPAANNIFIDRFAKILSDDSNNLNIDKSKLTELLDKLSDNKFSEEMQKQAEKTSYDQENGGFKNKEEQVFNASKEKLTTAKQELVLDNTPQEKESLPQIECIKPIKTSDFSIIQALERCSFEAIKNVITGKIKIQTKSEETSAIEGYKLMNTAMQGNLLQRSAGEFFDKLIDNTKTSTLKNLISIGWKGRSVAITEKVEETIEERKDDVA